MSINSNCWELAEVVSFFDSTRDKVEDVYPSEWFFLKDRIKENISVLDIGCAQGGFSNIFSCRLKEFSYTGIDISSSMISSAKKRFPQHRFLHCDEGDYTALNGEKFELVMVLGILHLHESWRNTISAAWAYTSGSLILDLRETQFKSIEDKKISYFNMTMNNNTAGSAYKLPYNIINTAEALAEVTRLCPGYKKIERYGYLHAISACACSPIQQVMSTVYCIEH